MKKSLLIPAYNAAGTLEAVIQSSRRFFDYVVVVDDGSQDSTADVVRACGVELVQHAVNRGKGAALLTGFRYLLDGGAEMIMTMDADGQHSSDDIPHLLSAWQKLQDEADERPCGILIGSRFSSKELIPRYRYYPNRIGQIIVSRVAGQPLEDTQSGFRIYHPGMVQELSLHTDHFELETEIIIKASRAGYRISFVPIETIYPEDEFDKTNFRPILDTYRIAVMVLKEIIRNGFHKPGA